MKILSNIKLESTSRSRLWHWISNFDCGTISACRGYQDEAYTRKDISESELSKYIVSDSENKSRTKKLEAILRAEKNVGYLSVEGHYPVTNPVTGKEEDSWEYSFFVFALNDKFNLKKFLIDLGKKFSQDTISYHPAGTEEFIFFQTNNFEGHKVGQEDFRANKVKFNDLFVIDSEKMIGDISKYFSKRKDITMLFYDDVSDDVKRQVKPELLDTGKITKNRKKDPNL